MIEELGDEHSIIKHLAIKYGLTESMVSMIVNSQFKFVSRFIMDGEEGNIMLSHFGKFVFDKRKKINRENRNNKDK